MSTPNGAVLLAVLHPDAEPVDVTEGVQALYDAVIGSLDWGSGFLSIEDVIPIARLARACGFDYQAPVEYLREELKCGPNAEAEAFLAEAEGSTT